MVKDRGWCKMNQPRRHQKLRFTEKRLCCQLGGIIKKFCTLNLYQETKRLIQTCTLNNSPNWAMQLKKRGQNWQIVRVLFSSMIMQSPTDLWSLAKNDWNLGWDVLSHPPYSPDFVPSDLPFISFHAELLMIKLLMTLMM